MIKQSEDARCFVSKKIHAKANILKYAKYIGEIILSLTDLTSIRSSKGAFRLYRFFKYRFQETEIKSFLPVKTDFCIPRKKFKSRSLVVYDQVFLRHDNISDAGVNTFLPDDTISNNFYMLIVIW